MIPYKSEKIIDANTTLTITCVYAFEDEYQKENWGIAWEIPDYLSKNAEVENSTCLIYISLFH